MGQPIQCQGRTQCCDCLGQDGVGGWGTVLCMLGGARIWEALLGQGQQPRAGTVHLLGKAHVPLEATELENLSYGAWFPSCAAHSQVMEHSFLSSSWGYASPSTVFRLCGVFSLYFLPPPFLELEKETKALRHLSAIELPAFCILSVL